MSKAVCIASILGLALCNGGPSWADHPHLVSDEDQPPVAREIETSGTTIFLQAPDQTNGVFSDTQWNQSRAMGFYLDSDGEGTIINQITVWGAYHPSDTPEHAGFDVIFHHLDPSTLLPNETTCSYNLMPAEHTATGIVLFGCHEYRIVFEIPSCVFQDGPHSVEIYAYTPSTNDRWFWEVGSVANTASIPDTLCANENPGVTWFWCAGWDLALKIDGEVVPVELQAFTIG